MIHRKRKTLIDNTTTTTPNKKQGVMWRALWRVHGRAFILTGALKVVHDAVMFAQPFVLEQLLRQLGGGADAPERGRHSRLVALGLAFALLGAALGEALLVNVYFMRLFRCGFCLVVVYGAGWVCLLACCVLWPCAVCARGPKN